MAAGLIGLLAPLASPTAALAAPAAPLGVSATRAPGDPYQIQVGWKSAGGADHYDVSVDNGVNSIVKTVPASVTSITVAAPDPCAKYTVTVGARDAGNLGGTTGALTVRSLAPFTPGGFSVARGLPDRTTATAAWKVPLWIGNAPDYTYRTQLIRVSDGVTMVDRTTEELQTSFTGLDRGEKYTVSLTSVNTFGSCLATTYAIGADLPGVPLNLTAVRDNPSNAAAVTASWQPPADLVTPPKYYEINYWTPGKLTKIVRVDAPATTATLSLDPRLAWSVRVRAFNEIGGSTTLSNTAALAATATAGNPDTIPPAIAVVQNPWPKAGWNNTPVSVEFVCSDTLSGVETCTPPVPVAAEGAAQTVTGVAVDYAGNATTKAATLNLDLTKPTISATVSPDPSEAGWSNGPVTVTFTCADALSGLAVCPAPVKVPADAATRTVIGGTATDRAGNTATTNLTVAMDITAPTAAATTVGTKSDNGWYRGPLTVTFTCADAGSGVAACPADATVGDGAGQSLTRSVTDKAGNTATTTITDLNVDATAPTVTATVVGGPTGSGWYSGPTTVKFTCTDTGSGVASCPADALVTQGVDTTVTGTATDQAGNTATTAVAVSIDADAPTIAANVAGTRSDDGWYTGPVTVEFTCTDGGAGVATCPAERSVTDGAGQTVTATVTDKVGNAATTTVTDLSVDGTVPTITATIVGDSTEAGWYRGPVTVTFTCADTLSGVSSCPEDSIVTEGVDKTVTGTVTDKAGNTATATVTVSIDTTVPTITADVAGTRNATGWFSGPVTVTFTCADALSGVVTCPADVTLADGVDQVVTGTAVDAAGNTATATVADLDVDTATPTITATVLRSKSDTGWYRGRATIAFTCADTGSGVASCPANTTVTTDQTVTGTVTDRAGNVDMTAIQIAFDATNPTISAVVAGTKTDSGWYRGAVTVKFTCADTLSGVAACPADVTIKDAAKKTVTGRVKDKVGNAATVSVADLDVDGTAPKITATVVGTKNAAGWYRGPVTVRFTCTDARSGVASCPADVTLTEGANQTVSGTAVDNAGNTATTRVSRINVDNTAPTVAVIGASDGSTYTLDAIPTPACQTTDATSPVAARAKLTTTRTAAGVYTATCAGAADRAGNTTTTSVTYTVSPTVPAAAALTTRYTSGKFRKALLAGLATGQYCANRSLIAADQSATTPKLTAARAAELRYWTTILSQGAC